MSVIIDSANLSLYTIAFLFNSLHLICCLSIECDLKFYFSSIKTRQQRKFSKSFNKDQEIEKKIIAVLMELVTADADITLF